MSARLHKGKRHTASKLLRRVAHLGMSVTLTANLPWRPGGMMEHCSLTAGPGPPEGRGRAGVVAGPDPRSLSTSIAWTGDRQVTRLGARFRLINLCLPHLVKCAHVPDNFNGRGLCACNRRLRGCQINED
jgi:hypothetical protein